MLMHKYVNVNYNHSWPIFGAIALATGTCIVYLYCSTHYVPCMLIWSLCNGMGIGTYSRVDGPRHTVRIHYQATYY